LSKIEKNGKVNTVQKNVLHFLSVFAKNLSSHVGNSGFWLENSCRMSEV